MTTPLKLPSAPVNSLTAVTPSDVFCLLLEEDAPDVPNAVNLRLGFEGEGVGGASSDADKRDRMSNGIDDEDMALDATNCVPRCAFLPLDGASSINGRMRS